MLDHFFQSCDDLFLFKILFIYSWETQRGRDTGRGRSREPCGEPDVGLNPRTLGSWPELRTDTRPLSHPNVPVLKTFKQVPKFFVKRNCLWFALKGKGNGRNGIDRKTILAFHLWCSFVWKNISFGAPFSIPSLWNPPACWVCIPAASAMEKFSLFPE